MSIYVLKIKVDGNGSKVISILRKFDPSVSIGEIRKRMQCDDFVVKYDLLHWDITAIESPVPYVRFFFVKYPAGVTVQFM